MPFLLTLRNLASVQKVCILRYFPQNVVNARFERKDGYRKLRNSHGKVCENPVGGLYYDEFCFDKGFPYSYSVLKREYIGLLGILHEQ